MTKKRRKRTRPSSPASARTADGAKRTSPVALLIAASAACAALAAAGMAIVVFRQDAEALPARPVPPAARGPARMKTFAEPAYTAEATADELKQEAWRIAEAITAAFPDLADSLAVSAVLQEHFGDFSAAEQIWRRCLQLDPESAEAPLRLAKIARERGDFMLAAAFFQRVTELTPDNLEAVALLGDCLLQAGRADEAVAVLEVYAQGDKVLDKSLLNLGQGYLQLQQYAKARDAFLRLVEADPTEARGYYGLAQAYARLGDRERSTRYLTEFRKRSTVDYADHRAEMLDYVDQETLRSVLAETLTRCGHIYRENGLLTEAEEMWSRGAVVDPRDTSSRSSLLYLFEQQRRDLDALGVCQELCELQPENAVDWFSQGVLQDRLGNRAAAKDALDRAVQLEPNNAQFKQAYEMIMQEI